MTTCVVWRRTITPTENPTVALLAFGEGWHNYHHAFPWDYKAAELGNYRLNFSTAFIDAFAFIGQAYDLKTADPGLVARRSRRTGHADGHAVDDNGNVWGWGDRDMADDDKRIARVVG